MDKLKNGLSLVLCTMLVPSCGSLLPGTVSGLQLSEQGSLKIQGRTEIILDMTESSAQADSSESDEVFDQKVMPSEPMSDYEIFQKLEHDGKLEGLGTPSGPTKLTPAEAAWLSDYFAKSVATGKVVATADIDDASLDAYLKQHPEALQAWQSP